MNKMKKKVGWVEEEHSVKLKLAKPDDPLFSQSAVPCCTSLVLVDTFACVLSLQHCIALHGVAVPVSTCKSSFQNPCSDIQPIASQQNLQNYTTLNVCLGAGKQQQKLSTDGRLKFSLECLIRRTRTEKKRTRYFPKCT